MTVAMPPILAVAVLALALPVCGVQGAPVPAVGPRGPVGPDAPLSRAQAEQSARRVTVVGRSAANVQAACERAVKEGVPVVFLPAGEYVFDQQVKVPGGLTLLGEGSETLIRTRDKRTHLFAVDGDGVRFTRLKLQGADMTPNKGNGTLGVSVNGRQNARVDHCELLGFCRATQFSGSGTSAQVDHCSIHHSLVRGLGYGLDIASGACVLVTDNEFSQNRHSLASNGTWDWGRARQMGKFVSVTGARKTHWEFLHNRVGSNDQSANEMWAVDAHPGMDGTFVVEGNVFEDLSQGVCLANGSGIIRGNLFRSLRSGEKPPQPLFAIGVWTAHEQSGIPFETPQTPHNVQIAQNTFLGPAWENGPETMKEHYGRHTLPLKYLVGPSPGPENISIDGEIVPRTRKEGGAPTPIPRLREMGEDGILRWREARPETSEGTSGRSGTARP